MTRADLIVAPATVSAGGCRAIVRIAGDGAALLVAGLVEPDAGCPTFSAAPADGRPRLIRGRLHPDGLGRDQGAVPVMVAWWPGPAGPTGGPLAEVHLPGSPPLVTALIAEACRRGARLARGGEFSLRSFLAGRLDLLQAEAVLAVVDARTPDELATALDRMAGGVGQALEELRRAALDLVADVEAAIDFADEAAPDAVPVAVPWDDLAGRIAGLEAQAAEIAAAVAGRDSVAVESLPRAVLVGPPNIGKSSLLNALVGRDAALVADESGTTRDWVAAPLVDASGQPACLVVDVAGIDGDGPATVSAAAATAADEIARADVIVACRDATAAAQAPAAAPRPVVHVITRVDRVAAGRPADGIATSAATGVGLEAARAAILAAATAAADRTPATVRLRTGLDAARAALRRAAAAVADARAGGSDEAIVAGCLHQAIDDMSAVTGREIGTDLLDRIFSRHCIGK